MTNYNNYDFTKKLLNNIRNIQENQKRGVISSNLLKEEVTQPDTFSSKEGQAASLNDMPNTRAFLRNMTNNDLTNEQRNNILASVSAFLKASGLILDIADVQVFNGRLVITSSNLRNPGITDYVKTVTIDTDLDDPKIAFIDPNVDIDSDYMTFVGALTRAYNDNTVGRTKLIQSSQIVA